MVVVRRRIAEMSIITILMLIFLVSSYADINPETIVAAYLFNGDAKDSSGNGKDGEVAGNVKWVNGKFDQAIELNGTNAWVEVPELGTFDEVTIAEWVNATGRVGQWRVLINNNGWKAGDIHHQLYPDDRVEFSIHSNPGGNDTFGTFHFDASQTNIWHHVTTVYSVEGWIRFYIDGELDIENKWGGNPGVLGPARIGSWDGGGREWQGMFDDFIIFNVALEENDIQNLMNKGLQEMQSVEPNSKLATSWGSIKNR